MAIMWDAALCLTGFIEAFQNEVNAFYNSGKHHFIYNSCLHTLHPLHEP